MFSWGSNYAGKLGNGTTIGTRAPILITKNFISLPIIENFSI
jgi:hypothetical protein